MTKPFCVWILTDMITDLLYKRRSVRSFEKKPVEAEKVEQLTEAGLLSPSSRSFYPWEIIVVDDPDRIETLSKAKPHGASFLAGAPLAFVIAADPDKSDVWVEDCSIVAILVQLKAEELGLGSCWIQIRNRTHQNGESSEDHVKRCCNLPERFRVDCLVAIGYPSEKKKPRTKDDLDTAKAHRNYFQPAM